MRFLIVATAALLPSASSAAEPQRPAQPQAMSATPAKVCQKNEMRHAESTERPAPRTLDQLPAGNLMLAVHREVEGCMEPVIVRYDVGSNKAVQEPERLPVRLQDNGQPAGRGL